jgi:hypothetical protein
VNAIVRTTDTVYIGGDFSLVEIYTGRGAPIDTTSGLPVGTFPRVNDIVRASVSDGAGGWYIGGEFTEVGGVARNRIAHILADGTVDPAWDPNAGDAVYALAVSGSTVYAGGFFTSIGGQTRNRIAALDAATGSATAWDPNAGSRVKTLAISGSTIYAGGQFTTIGGQTRNNIAALDAATGDATAWNPNAGSTVRALAVSGSTVYAGGFFSSIGGQTRNRIAALDAATGDATAWNPSANSVVYALAVSGSTVYAGGDFTSIGEQTRNHIAALDATTGGATAWNPNADNIVYALAVDGSSVFAGGEFATIGGNPRQGFAEFAFPPAAPSSPGATAIATNQITWTWTDNSNNETGFKVYSGQGPTAPGTVSATTFADETQWTTTSLAHNTQYAFQVAATNSGTDSVKTINFAAWTLAAVPVAPTVDDPQLNSLRVQVGSGDDNPADTLYAIYNVTLSQWVQAGGTLGGSEVWQTVAAWNPTTVTGLLPDTLYEFKVKAKNGADVETALGPGASATTTLPNATLPNAWRISEIPAGDLPNSI